MEAEILDIQKKYGRKEVLRGTSFRVAPGSCMGVLGANGSGKSTLLKILAGVLRPNAGRFLWQGEDLLRHPRLRASQVAYVPQEALLFHRSIRENIAYGRPDATDEEIREAARLANALEFVDRLPKGLDTMVGERGVKLSGGQLLTLI